MVFLLSDIVLSKQYFEDELSALKECWPNIIYRTSSENDLTQGRISESLVKTIDDFEQCWVEEYYTSIKYRYVRHLISSSFLWFMKKNQDNEFVTKNLLFEDIEETLFAFILEHLNAPYPSLDKELFFIIKNNLMRK